VKKLVEAGLLIAFAAPAVTVAQSWINGTWKLDIEALPLPTRMNVWVPAEWKVFVQIMHTAD
jgi:hypothetical protein